MSFKSIKGIVYLNWRVFVWIFWNMWLGPFLVTVLLTVSVAWKDYDFRFLEPAVTEGTVQVFFEEKWHSVCQRSWFLRPVKMNTVGNVVCSTMGFGRSNMTRMKMHHRDGKPTSEGGILLMARCTGKEKRIEQCRIHQASKITHKCKSILQVGCTGEAQESPGSIDCTEDKFKLLLNVGSILQFFPEVDPDNITLTDSSCKVGDGKRPISIEAPISGCGTTSKENSTDRTYTNQLLYTDSSGHVTQLHTIECSFRKVVEITQKVKTIPRSVMVISGRGKVPVTMNVYKDHQLKEKLERILFQSSELLYIEVGQSGTNSSSMSFLPNECHCKSSLESSNSSLQLISEGCPVAGRATLVESPAKGVVMAVKTATLRDVSTDDIDIVCTASVCQNKCTHTCPPDGTISSVSGHSTKGRRKREVGLYPGVASVHEGSIPLNSRKKQ